MGDNSHDLKQNTKHNTCAFSKGEEIKNGAQIVQFSKKKSGG